MSRYVDLSNPKIFHNGRDKYGNGIYHIPPDLPTDDVVERKSGEWIPAFNGTFTGGAYWFSCSKCNRIVPEVRNGGWNFCPNCGADMREYVK